MANYNKIKNNKIKKNLGKSTQDITVDIVNNSVQGFEIFERSFESLLDKGFNPEIPLGKPLYFEMKIVPNVLNFKSTLQQIKTACDDYYALENISEQESVEELKIKCTGSLFYLFDIQQHFNIGLMDCTNGYNYALQSRGISITDDVLFNSNNFLDMLLNTSDEDLTASLTTATSVIFDGTNIVGAPTLQALTVLFNMASNNMSLNTAVSSFVQMAAAGPNSLFQNLTIFGNGVDKFQSRGCNLMVPSCSFNLSNITQKRGFSTLRFLLDFLESQIGDNQNYNNLINQLKTIVNDYADVESDSFEAVFHYDRTDWIIDKDFEAKFCDICSVFRQFSPIYAGSRIEPNEVSIEMQELLVFNDDSMTVKGSLLKDFCNGFMAYNQIQNLIDFSPPIPIVDPKTFVPFNNVMENEQQIGPNFPK